MMPDYPNTYIWIMLLLLSEQYNAIKNMIRLLLSLQICFQICNICTFLRKYFGRSRYKIFLFFNIEYELLIRTEYHRDAGIKETAII